MLKIQSDRIIIDGHEPAKEQCETMTLLANALAESKNFKTVEYRDGYAEFERVGHTEELKFWYTAQIVGTLNGETFSIAGVSPPGSGNFSISASISATGLQVTFSGTLGGRLNIGGNNAENYFVPWDSTIEYSAGDTANFEFKSGVQLLSTPGALDNGFAITLSAPSKLSVDLTTLSGWSSLSSGSHNITIVAKADGYRDSEPSAAVSVEKGAQEYTDCITFAGESSDFTLSIDGGDEWDGTVEYSTDHNTWAVWDGTAVSSVDKKLYLRGSGNTTFYTDNGVRLVLSARAACSGNIQTLLEYSNPPTTLVGYCYSGMFQGCTNLTQAPELPATTLAEGCYSYMFDGCTSLTAAPELPATTLAEGCYSYMFDGCTSLTAAPELPATTLADYCYSSMFYGCISLTQAPELPATTLADSCYSGMFNGCTNLTAAPELPATTLAGSCYSYMFQGCTSLTQAPELPATTLAAYCYSNMFNGCTNLTAAPELPATTLAAYCYSNMFYGCTSLKISSTQSTEYPIAWRIPSSGTISSQFTGWNSAMLTGTGGTFTGDPTINTTYYGAWTK